MDGRNAQTAVIWKASIRLKAVGRPCAKIKIFRIGKTIKN
jgi:hypothetical protein